MKTRHCLIMLLPAALVLPALSLACLTTVSAPAFSTQVAQTVQAQLDATNTVTAAADQIATGVAATIIASGGTPPPEESTPPPAGPTSATGPGSTPTPADPPEVDFNGDGYTDLVAGIPGLADGNDESVGGFYLFTGGPDGLGSAGERLWRAREILPFAAANGNFGSVIEAGDFDGDGFSDLALVYLPGSNANQGGLLVLLYGSADGITTDQLELWDQDVHLREGEGLSPGTLGKTGSGDAFAMTLSAGDFNADGFEDLAIGIPFKDLGPGEDHGAVNVLYGSAAGLTHVGNALINQNGFFIEQDDQSLQTGDLIAGAEAGDGFGMALAVGDINGDSFDDLVIGVPSEAIGDVEDAGVVHVVYGSSTGLTPAGNQHPHEAGFYTDTDGDGGVDANIEGGLSGEPEEAAGFGTAIAVADFNGDGFGDLAVGAPGKPVNGRGSAGSVHVIFGSPDGLTTENGLVWDQQTGTRIDGASVPGLLPGDGPEESDRFGSSLQAADFNADGFADLAIGAVAESLPDASFSGSVSVLYGSPTGPAADGGQWFNQVETSERGITGPGLAGEAEPEGSFGFAFTHGDYDEDGIPDLVIAAPFITVDGATMAGEFYILFGNPETGLAAQGHQFWTTSGGLDSQGNPVADLGGSPADFEFFGFGLR